MRLAEKTEHYFLVLRSAANEGRALAIDEPHTPTHPHRCVCSCVCVPVGVCVCVCIFFSFSFFLVGREGAIRIDIFPFYVCECVSV